MTKANLCFICIAPVGVLFFLRLATCQSRSSQPPTGAKLAPQKGEIKKNKKFSSFLRILKY